MTKREHGFSAFEAVIILLVVGLVAFGGYMVINRSAGKVTDNTKNAAEAAAQTSSVPEVKDTSDLTTADETLQDTDLDASLTDSSQLDSELNNF